MDLDPAPLQSVSIAVESKVEQFSDAPDDQHWRSCGLARLFTDAPKQSPHIQRQRCMYQESYNSYYTRVWYSLEKIGCSQWVRIFARVSQSLSSPRWSYFQMLRTISASAPVA